eukprot:GHVR01139152.1.p1 GENE.GHVR01139152.1~~GHVR01139152.1.p1  ORF type:complete len:527 (+),score=158.71 GHVR01139152.1:582-2162(+)
MGGGFILSRSDDAHLKYGRHDLRYGVCAMQGWRESMEDAHVCLPHLEHTHPSDPNTHPLKQDAGGPCFTTKYIPNRPTCTKPASVPSRTAFFGIFDGHGGAEVAQVVAERLPLRFTSHPDYHEGRYTEALHKCYLLTDYDLLRDDTVKEMREIYRKRCLPIMKKTVGTDKDRSGKSLWGYVSRLFSNSHTHAFHQAHINAYHTGCTATTLFIDGDIAYISNAGDSRVIMCTACGTAVALTTDHKPHLASELSRICRAGGVVMNGRVMGNLNLSRAIGDWYYKAKSDTPLEEQLITSCPEIERINLTEEKADFFLIGCDGIFETRDNQWLIDFIRTRIDDAPSYSSILEELLTSLLSTDPTTDMGAGCDNMSAIIVDIRASTRHVLKATSPPVVYVRDTQDDHQETYIHTHTHTEEIETEDEDDTHTHTHTDENPVEDFINMQLKRAQSHVQSRTSRVYTPRGSEVSAADAFDTMDTMDGIGGIGGMGGITSSSSPRRSVVSFFGTLPNDCNDIDDTHTHTHTQCYT